jgi:hypothetical protein
MRGPMSRTKNGTREAQQDQKGNHIVQRRKPPVTMRRRKFTEKEFRNHKLQQVTRRKFPTMYNTNLLLTLARLAKGTVGLPCS